MKKCSVCEEVKELSQYRKSKSGKLGLDACCKLCKGQTDCKSFRFNIITKFCTLYSAKQGNLADDPAYTYGEV